MPQQPDSRGRSIDTCRSEIRTDIQTALGGPAAGATSEAGQGIGSEIASASELEIGRQCVVQSGVQVGVLAETGNVPAAANDSGIQAPAALTEKAARELAQLKSQLHALASPDGFAPTREEFARAVRRTSRPYCKFFSGYEEFIRSCGYKGAADRRREAAADRRQAEWAAARTASDAARPAVLKNSGILAQPKACGVPAKPKPNSKPRTNEMFYGDPIHCCDMAHAPVNEQGVVLLFGVLARKLKFRIEMVRTGYPDCEAKRQGEDGKWRRLRIEFEFKTSRFNHDPAGCDLIVCWEDDANPTDLEVLELKNHVGREEEAEGKGADGKGPNGKEANGKAPPGKKARSKKGSRSGQPAGRNSQRAHSRLRNQKSPVRPGPRGMA